VIAAEWMKNDTVFGPDRKYRYLLKHTWESHFAPRLCAWIGLNPSVADETRLDPTLRRIRKFSTAWGYNAFIMTNLFALVSTDPKRLYTEPDPIGPENDAYILQAVCESELVVASWGTLGRIQNRCTGVLKFLSEVDLHCLKRTKDGYPSHPLYVAGETKPMRYRR
jgi:hypothetical protein